MTDEWTDGFSDVQKIKDSIISTIRTYAESPTIVYRKIEAVESQAKRNLKTLEDSTLANHTFSEDPRSIIDAQGYINDHYHEKLYEEAYADVHSVQEHYKDFTYEYDYGISMLDIIKSDTDDTTLKQAVNNALKEIQDIDDYYLKESYA